MGAACPEKAPFGVLPGSPISRNPTCKCPSHRVEGLLYLDVNIILNLSFCLNYCIIPSRWQYQYDCRPEGCKLQYSNEFDQGHQRLFALSGRIYTTVGIDLPSNRPPTLLTMFLRSSVLLAAFLHVTHGSIATYLDLYHRSSSLPHLLARAANHTSGLDVVGPGYNINITLGGKTFSVQIDTGRWALHSSTPRVHRTSCLPAVLINPSADLWVAGTVPGAIDTGANATVQYAVGSDGGMHVLHHAGKFESPTSRTVSVRSSENGTVGDPRVHRSRASIQCAP